MKVAAVALIALGLGLILSANAQTNTPSSVEPPNQAKGGQKTSPGSVGAMQNTVGNKATSAEDVQRQSEGRPTAAQEAQGQQTQGKQPNPTQSSPGTVGAAPGANTPSQVPKK